MHISQFPGLRVDINMLVIKLITRFGQWVFKGNKHLTSPALSRKGGMCWVTGPPSRCRYYFPHLGRCLKIGSALAAVTADVPSLTFSPETQAPLRRGDLAILVAVAGVEEGPDADLILVQVNGCQLGVVQIQIIVRVQLWKHPANGVLAAGYEAPVQRCQRQFAFSLPRSVLHLFAQTVES